jgi:hypothetical protein
VKLTHGGHIERWAGSGLLVAERQFRKVIGFRHIPVLLSSVATAATKKPAAKSESRYFQRKSGKDPQSESLPLRGWFESRGIFQTSPLGHRGSDGAGADSKVTPPGGKFRPVLA